MLIKINNQFTPGGQEYYQFELWDGPDGIEHITGFSTDLVEAFTKILEWRERISHDYFDDLID